MVAPEPQEQTETIPKQRLEYPELPELSNTADFLCSSPFTVCHQLSAQCIVSAIAVCTLKASFKFQ